jgi:Amt family ammonium transporter
MLATATGVLSWLLVERIRDGHPTSLGAASGAVAGLVAITPACAFVTPIGAVGIGFLAGTLCALAVSLKFRFGFDDSLDVVGVHLVGGLVGSLAIGLFASTSVNELGKDGLFYGGGLDVLGTQAVGSFAVLGYSLVVTLVLGLVLNKTLGFRVPKDDEVSGIDLAQHAETGYELLPAGGSSPSTGVATHTSSSDRKVHA